jgi:hypothetical protein
MQGNGLSIMVSSAVYGSESDLDQIKSILIGFGYDVIMSKDGNINIRIDETPEEACLRAVEECDLFFGVLFPRYGSGVAHKEFNRAIELNKPMWFVAHGFIKYTKNLMHQFMYDGGDRNDFDIQSTTVLDSLKVIDMYNDVPSDKWIQSFSRTSEIQLFIETQFKDISKISKQLEARR